MTIVFVVKSPYGIVLAADSRYVDDRSSILPAREINHGTAEEPRIEIEPAKIDRRRFDSNTGRKIFSLAGQSHIGVGFSGAMCLTGTRLTPLDVLVPKFDDYLKSQVSGRLPVGAVAKQLKSFLLRHRGQADGPMNALVVGFDPGAEWGSIYAVAVPSEEDPEEYHPDRPGLSYSGDTAILDHIISRVDLPLYSMTLQDCVQLAGTICYTTATLEAFRFGSQGIGGPIDIATITYADGFSWVQKKAVQWVAATAV